MKKLVVAADLSELDRVLNTVRQAAKDMEPQDIARLCLAVEELFVNICSYAYPAGETGSATLGVWREGKRLYLTLCDSGVAFDPTAAPEAAVDMPTAERPVGGLGIHLVKQIADELRYRREGGENILVLCYTPGGPKGGGAKEV